jgi:hypothetical protein
MTVEQVLVFLLAATAGIVLFLGLAQALDDRPARARRRRRRTADPWEGASGPNSVLPGGTPSETSQTTVASPPIPPALEPGPHAVEADPPAALAQSAADPDLVMVEDAMGLCLGGRCEELLARLEPRLAADRGVSAEGPRSHVMTALHSLTGLARHALGDASAAPAFEAGVRSLPGPGFEACPPRIAALSVQVARRLLEGITGPSDQDGGGRAGESADRACLAAFWLSWRLHAAPGDQRTLELLDTAREALAEAHAEAAAASIRRHEYGAARAVVKRAVDAGELPSVRGEILLELLGATFRREIDQLTAAAIRGGNDESRAVTGLGQAEALLGTMPEGAIGPTHRAAAAQRVWRGHSKLGFRRLRLGQLDDAADTLFHALAMREIGRRRQRQVRDALVRTLEGLGDQRAAAVSILLAEGKQPAAAEEITRLELRVQRAREQGVSDEELEVASSKLEQLRRRLDESTTVR